MKKVVTKTAPKKEDPHEAFQKRNAELKELISKLKKDLYAAQEEIGQLHDDYNYKIARNEI